MEQKAGFIESFCNENSHIGGTDENQNLVAARLIPKLGVRAASFEKDRLMNCQICGKPVVLVPSAKERAEKHGGHPDDYTRLFPSHVECALRKREADVRELINRTRKGSRS